MSKIRRLIQLKELEEIIYSVKGIKSDSIIISASPISPSGPKYSIQPFDDKEKYDRTAATHLMGPDEIKELFEKYYKAKVEITYFSASFSKIDYDIFIEIYTEEMGKNHEEI